MFKYSLFDDIYSFNFYACLTLRFPDVETKPDPGIMFMVSALYSAVMCVASRNLMDLAVARLSMIYCSVPRPWSVAGVIYQSYWFLNLIVMSCCAGTECLRVSGMAVSVRDAYGEFHQFKCECYSCEMLVLRVCGARQDFYVFSLYRTLT